MLRRKQREEIIEDAYNRYAFEDDPRDLPDWFVDGGFMKAERYTTRETTRKLYLMSPLKLTNDRLRKSPRQIAQEKRAKDKMSEARQRAGAIMDQDDIPDVSKVREIEAIYAKANKLVNGTRSKSNVVARKLTKATPADRP